MTERSDASTICCGTDIIPSYIWLYRSVSIPGLLFPVACKSGDNLRTWEILDRPNRVDFLVVTHQGNLRRIINIKERMTK